MSDSQEDAWILKVLGFAVDHSGTQAEAGTQAKGSVVALQKSRLAWDSLRKSVQLQLRGIEEAVLSTVAQHNADPEGADEYDPADVAGKIRSIYGILETIDTRLIDRLDQALNAEGEAREGFSADARKILGEYSAAVAASPLLARIDANGFASTSIRDATQKTLADLAVQL